MEQGVLVPRLLPTCAKVKAYACKSLVLNPPKSLRCPRFRISASLGPAPPVLYYCSRSAPPIRILTEFTPIQHRSPLARPRIALLPPMSAPVAQFVLRCTPQLTLYLLQY